MKNLNAIRLFSASFLTLIAAGIGFSVRTAVLADWSKDFGFTSTDLGLITGGGLTGFGITIIFLSFFADRIGYGPLMVLAFLLHTSSAVVTMLARPVFDPGNKFPTYCCLYIGMFLFSLGNGTCEAVINPLTATLFPKNKTHWLNILHAGWPGGLVLGAFIPLGFTYFVGHVAWEIQMLAFLIPTLLYGALMLGCTFPRSEANVSGVTLKEMMQELGLGGALIPLLFVWVGVSGLCFAFGMPGMLSMSIGSGAAAVLLLVFGYFCGFHLGHGVLIALLVLHALVGYVELGTDSWIPRITGMILNNPNYGLMLFIWTSSLMFCLRFFAGPIVHKISPLGLLLGSALLGCTGLLLLGFSNGIILCVIAATVYGFGKTFFWPTMLGVASERFPKGGALTLGMMGGVGMLSAGLLGGPGIGYKQDYFASNYLKQQAPEAYQNYKSDEENAFLPFLGVFPKISGLDGGKVAVLEDNGEQLKKDMAVLQREGESLTAPERVELKQIADKIEANKEELTESDYKTLKKLSAKMTANLDLKVLNQWWKFTGEPNAERDKAPVKSAKLEGGQMAFIVTAAVPATMAVGYLLLLLYFSMTGGYKVIHLEQEQAPVLPKVEDKAPQLQPANGAPEEGFTDGIPGEGVQSTPL